VVAERLRARGDDTFEPKVIQHTVRGMGSVGSQRARLRTAELLTASKTRWGARAGAWGSARCTPSGHANCRAI